jgi:hypothetical protein
VPSGNPSNNSPVAVNDGLFEVVHGQVLTVDAPGVLANDYDLDDDPLTLTLITGPAHGALTLNQDGSFTYEADADYVGPDEFTYQLNDGTDDSNIATVSLSVTNAAPNAVDDTVVAVQGMPLFPIEVLSNDTDPDGDALAIVSFTEPAHGILLLNSDDNTFAYLPDQDWSGNEQFDYTVSDGHGGTDTATVYLQVNSNAAPVAASVILDNYAPKADETITATVSGAYDADPGDSVTLLFDWYVNGNLVRSAESTTSTDSLELGQEGSAKKGDTVFVRVTPFDGPAVGDAVDSPTATVANSPPVGAEDDYVIHPGLTFASGTPGLLDNNTDLDPGETLQTFLVDGPSSGDLVLNTDGSFEYTPDPEVTSGSVNFTYRRPCHNRENVASDHTARPCCGTVSGPCHATRP